MNQFGKEDFEKLSDVKGENCVSIFIPTHSSGLEVNEGLDKINLKNKLQEVKGLLESKGASDITGLMSKANGLVEDGSFWRQQDESLALFFNAKSFKVYKLPIKVKEFVSVGSKFELSPLVPLLAENESYYILSLDLGNIRLVKNTRFSTKNVDVSNIVPDSFDEVLSYFNFNKESQVRGTNFEEMKFTSQANKGQAMHSSNPRDKETRYVQDFLTKVESGLTKLFQKDNIPVVLAGSDNICGYYRELSKYKNIESQTINGSIDRFNEKELIEVPLKIVEKSLNKEKKQAIDKYPVWAGTGKASYDLATIVNAANDGRIESLFIVSDTHIWGTFDEKTQKVAVHKSQEKGDICLIDFAVMKTIENNGRAFTVSKEEMPEKTVDTKISATFRY